MVKRKMVYAIIGLLVLAIGVLFFMLFSRTQSLKEMHVEYSVRTYYEMSKLEFCVDKSISPCDDEQIKTWNENAPNDTFELKDFRQLTESAIEANKNLFWQY